MGEWLEYPDQRCPVAGVADAHDADRWRARLSAALIPGREHQHPAPKICQIWQGQWLHHRARWQDLPC
jgi:hypothetical protein